MRWASLALIALVFGLSKAQEIVIFDLILSINDDACSPDPKNFNASVTLNGNTLNNTFEFEVANNQIKFSAIKEVKLNDASVSFEASWTTAKEECQYAAELTLPTDLSFKSVSFSVIKMTTTTATTTTTKITTAITTTTTTTNTTTNGPEPTAPDTTLPSTTTTQPKTTGPDTTLTVRYAVLPKPPKDEKKCNSHGGAVAFAVIEALIIVALVAFLLFKFCIQPRRNFGGTYPPSAYYDNTTGRGENIDSYRRPRTQDIGMDSYSYAIDNGHSNPVSRPVNTPTTTTTSTANRVALPMVTMSSNNPPPLSPTTPALVPIDISSPNPSPNNRPNQNQNQNQNHLDLSLAWNDPFQ